MQYPERLGYDSAPRPPGADERELVAQELSLHFAADH